MNESFSSNVEQEKRKRIQEIFSYEDQGERIAFTPDAIVALSGSIIEAEGLRESYEGYKSPSYKDTDNKGLTSGGKARIIATAEASLYFPHARIITNSKDVNKESIRPTHAEVYKHELTKYGVAPEQIEVEESSDTTLSGLLELVKLSLQDENNWQNIAVVTNDYHIPRVSKMCELLPTLILDSNVALKQAVADFNSQHKKIIAISAEEILIARDPHYKALIEAVKKSDAYQQRLIAEAQGLKDLEAGRYNPNMQSKH